MINPSEEAKADYNERMFGAKKEKKEIIVQKMEVIASIEHQKIIQYRTHVFGGWIVTSYSLQSTSDGESVSTHQIFIPDPNHLWEL